MIILGIDPGTAIVGYSVVENKENKIKILDYGCIITEKDLKMEERLEKIFLKLETIINLYKPTQMAIEELFFFKNQKTIISVAQSRGIILLKAQLSGLEIFSYTPLQVKTGITGYGRASKKQVQDMLKILLNLEEAPKQDDAADAIAIAVNHINTMKKTMNIVKTEKNNNIKKEINLSNKKNNSISVEEIREILKKSKKR